MEQVKKLLKSGEATVVDVRTPYEFMGGNAPGSINIPMDEIESRIDELREMSNLVLCCASGNRSNMVMMYLQSEGIQCHNAGSWMDVNYHLNVNTQA